MTYSSDTTGGTTQSTTTSTTTSTSTSTTSNAGGNTVIAAGNTPLVVNAQGSNAIFAYYASEPDNLESFPRWDDLPDESKPFSFVLLEKGKKYKISNNFGTLEGFAVQLWFADKLDAAYGLSGVTWIRGGLVERSRTVEFIAEDKYLFAGTVTHTIDYDLSDNPILDLRGYELPGTISRVYDSDEKIEINPESLFLIQQEDELYSINAIELKDYFSPLAIGEDYAQDNYGTPGLMFPGTGLNYNEVTGKVDAEIPASPNFVGLLGAIANPFTVNHDKNDPHPLNQSVVVQNPSGSEQEGDYYVVVDTEFELSPSWGFSENAKVYRGDAVVRRRLGTNPGNFEIIPSIEGALSVMKLNSVQYAINFDNTRVQYPQLSVLSAKAPMEDEDFEPGYDGFLSKEDKHTINTLKQVHIEQDYTVYPPIT